MYTSRLSSFENFFQCHEATLLEKRLRKWTMNEKSKKKLTV